MKICTVNILLRHLVFSPWLIHAPYAHSVIPEINSFISGTSTHQKISPCSHSIISPDGSLTRFDSYSINNIISAPKGSIAIIEVIGVIFQYDQACGPIGTTTLLNLFNAANSAPNISGIILVVDSPGGQVAGTKDFADAISNSKKPVVTYAKELMCSAGYWIGSSADYIIANNELAEFGSIGTMCTLIDDTVANEQEGYKVLVIRATESDLKNEKYYQALSGNDSLLKNDLNYINSFFLKAVKSNRKNKIDLNKSEIFRGETFFAKDALKYGLIDKIGTIQDAISFINNYSKKNNMSQNTRPNLNKALNLTADHESTEQGSFLQTAELDTIERILTDNAELQNSITALNQALAEQTTAAANASAQLESATETINELTTEVSNWKQKATELGYEESTTATTPIVNSMVETEASKTTSAKRALTGIESEVAKMKETFSNIHQMNS